MFCYDNAVFFSNIMLYARWHKPEKTLEYKEKWLNAKSEQSKNITHRNA